MGFFSSEIPFPSPYIALPALPVIALDPISCASFRPRFFVNNCPPNFAPNWLAFPKGIAALPICKAAPMYCFVK